MKHAMKFALALAALGGCVEDTGLPTVAARYQDVRTVEYDCRRVTYATNAEMAAAPRGLNRQISGTTARIAVVRIQSSKGR